MKGPLMTELLQYDSHQIHVAITIILVSYYYH